jgi:molecular chaperone GrpE
LRTAYETLRTRARPFGAPLFDHSTPEPIDLLDRAAPLTPSARAGPIQPPSPPCYVGRFDGRGAQGTARRALSRLSRSGLTAGPDPDDRARNRDRAGRPDLFTLLAEVATLKNEVKLESRQVKGALDEFRALFEALQTSQTRLDEETGRRRDSERRPIQDAQRDLLLELLDLRDRLEGRARPGATLSSRRFGQRKAQAFVGSMAEGLAISLRRLDETLARREVRAFEALGHRFDPHTDARRRGGRPSRATRAGIVVRELRKGFLIGERLLRPAEVKVNRPSRGACDASPDKPGRWVNH